MMSLTIGQFSAFIRAVHGQDPFPWQLALLNRVAAGEGWPTTVRAPTGAGKTLALDIAVWHLATGGVAVPRRLFWVVDRRLVADQVYDRAQRLAAALRESTGGIVRAVADALMALDETAKEPLDVKLWRGGVPLDDEAPLSPAQACVIVSTVDQVGSRMLFRGYGVSPAMAPIHAGLTGMDSLILLDEAHIAIPFGRVVDAVRHLQSATWCREPLAAPEPVKLVRVTATAADPTAPALLGPADHADPVLGPRLSAVKTARLVEVRDADLAATVAERASALLDQGGEVRRVAAVLNTVGRARAVHRLLSGRGIDTVLLTGRMRPVDRDAVWERWHDRLVAVPGRDRAAEPPCVVVATQAIEVGVDLDLDGMVSEAAPLAALAQRVGRVDRLGVRGDSPLVLVCPTERLRAKPVPDPVYGESVGATWAWLKENAVVPAVPKRGRKAAGEATIDLGWATLDAVPAPIWETLAGKAPPYEPLDSVMAGLFARTHPRPEPDPDPALFLHGRGGEGEVQVVWRDDLFERDLGAPERAIALVDSCPPVRAEALVLPLSAARRWLAEQDEDVLADAPSAAPREDRVTRGRRALLWAGAEDSRVVQAGDLRPGMTLLVPADRGGIDPESLTWDPGAGKPVPDRADQARAKAGRPSVFRLRNPDDRHQLEALHLIKALLDEDGEALGEDFAERLEKKAAEILPPDHRWHPLIARVTSAWTIVPYDPARLREGFVLREPGPETPIPTTETDGSLDGGARVGLGRHLAEVSAMAETFASARGLTGAPAEAVWWGALLHDLGKVEKRFQAMLCGGDRLAVTASEPLAKGERLSTRAARAEARRLAGLPRGVRHEAWSLALAERVALPDSVRELAQWLVATHHGRCRPLPSVPPAGAAATLRLPWPDGPVLEADYDVGASSVGANWPGRFERLTRRHGPWGLAWLEAVVRLSDHRCSASKRKTDDAEPRDHRRITLADANGGQARHVLSLPGLRADTLAGFLAGLGVLRLLTGAWPDDGVRLVWGEAFPHSASLSADRPLDRASVLDTLEAALARDHAALPAFAGRADVGFAPDDLREKLEGACKDGDEAASSWLRAFSSATGWGGDSDRADVTPFIMLGAGNTNFLKAARTLAKAVGGAHLERTLFHPWDYADGDLYSLRWDPEDTREHAYAMHDPKEPAAWKGNEPRRMAGANRLALAALPCLPVVPSGKRPVATGTRRLDRDLAFVWPVWSAPADLATACALLSAPDGLRSGLATILCSVRASAGRYPIVLPARPLPPKVRRKAS